MNLIKKKSVLVTGGTRGLGVDIARALLEQGYCVQVVGRSESKELMELLENYSNDLSFYEFDVSQTSAIKDLVHSIVKENGPIYGLVNNAAIGGDGVLATMHENDIAMVLKVNLEAPILFAKYCFRSMLRQKSGVVVNVSSIIASTGYSGLSVYGASKAGLDGFTRSAAREFGKIGIRVVSIAPGYMKTGMTQGMSEEKVQKIVNRSPFNRLVDTAEVANMVGYLVSDNGASITGCTITIDAGSTA